jgi:hypothetical protein
MYIYIKKFKFKFKKIEKKTSNIQVAQPAKSHVEKIWHLETTCSLNRTLKMVALARE